MKEKGFRKGNVLMPTEGKTSNGKKFYVSRFTYYIDGVRKQGKSDRKDKKVDAIHNAEYKLRIIEDEYVSGVKSDKKDKMTISELANDYIQSIKDNNVTDILTNKATIVSSVRSLVFSDGHNTKFKYTPESIKNLPVKKLDKNVLNEWLWGIEELYSDNKISYKTYAKFRGTINRLLRHAEKLGLFKDDLNRIYELEIEFDRHCKIYKKPRGTFVKNKPYNVVHEKEFKMMLNDGLFFRNGYPMPEFLEAYEEVFGEQFIRAIRDYVILSVMFYGALRASEVRTLQINDFKHLPNGTRVTEVYDNLTEEDIEKNKDKRIDNDMFKIFVDRALSYKVLPEDRELYNSGNYNHLKSKDANRIAFIIGDVYYAIEDYIERITRWHIAHGVKEEDAEKQLMFPSFKTGGYISDHGFDYITERAVKRLKSNPDFAKEFRTNDELEEWKFTKHDFRRSRITIMLEKGVPVEYVRDFVGHSDVDIIKQYYDARRKEDKFRINTMYITEKAFESDEQLEYGIAGFKKSYEEIKEEN